jgi:SAM-dependent methyltransferase
MGFDAATIEILLTAREAGVSFDRVLMAGRQSLRVSPSELRSVLSRHRIPLSPRQVNELMSGEKGYCEPLLKFLGAQSVHSMDASNYEGASILHDLNETLPDSYRDQFSVVIDGGTLEHVFDFPTALKNCMKAVAPGGHFIGITPSNNLMGHGFYQVSPELFFRVFTPSNGFKIVKLLVYEYPWRSVWYEVLDPEQARRRVELTNSRPAYVIVWATKIASLPIFQRLPQQSDYQALWQRSQASATADPAPPCLYAPWLTRFVPYWMTRMYRAVCPFRSKLYKKVSVTGRSNALGGRRLQESSPAGFNQG